MCKLLVILGPTATGKTDIAFSLAKKFNGELISADSRQVYKNLDIGTGKMPSKVKNLKKEKGRWIVDGISIHLYDIAQPKDQYNVSKFVKDAEKIIEDMYKRGKLPIVVGGTGLYIKALADGLDNLSVPVDKKLRKELENLTKKNLQEKLQKINSQRWKGMNVSDRENPRRLIRAIELSDVSLKDVRLLRPRYELLKIGLTSQREILYKNANLSILQRIDQGMIKEAEKLLKEGMSVERMKQLGLEYGVLADYLEGNISQEELVPILEGRIHGYIRRQLTFFKKERNIKWFDISDNFLPEVEKMVAKWYDPL